jgi:hypothetical protein
MNFKDWTNLFNKIDEHTKLSVWCAENILEYASSTRYSVEVNFRTKPKEALNAFAKIALGYVSAAMKQRDFRIKAVFEQEPYRIIASSRNWDDGEWDGMVYFLPDYQGGTFMLAKGFYDERAKTIRIQGSPKICDGDSAAEITKELFNLMNSLKGKPDRHLEKLKSVPLKRGPKR